jgi:hypothetical protein
LTEVEPFLPKLVVLGNEIITKLPSLKTSAMDDRVRDKPARVPAVSDEVMEADSIVLVGNQASAEGAVVWFEE